MTPADLAQHYTADELLAALCARMDPANAVAAVRAVAPFLSDEDKAVRTKRLAAERSKRSYDRKAGKSHVSPSEPHAEHRQKPHASSEETASDSHAEPSENGSVSDGPSTGKELPPSSAPSPGPPSPPAPSHVIPPVVPQVPPSPAATGQGKKAKEQKPEPPPDPRFTPVTEGYCTAYLETFGTAYVHNGGRDGKRLKQFLATASAQEFTAERIVRVARAAMKRSGEPFAKATKFATSLSSFCDQFNIIRGELNGSVVHGGPGKSGLNAARPPLPVKVADLEAFIASDPDHERYRSILQNPPATAEKLPNSIKEKFTLWFAKNRP